MKPTRTERFLRIFTDVRPGEGTTALLMFANVFLILCAYYFIKPLREGWIAVSGVPTLTKMEVKAYSSFGQSLLFVLAVGGYGRLVDRYARATVIGRATVFCMANLVVFWFLQPEFFFRNLPGTGVIFYLWVGMFGVFVVAQFWAFAADLYAEEQGERLIPLIAIGATAGAATGAWMTER
jgi:AAA family ATP:ADP antiporter